MRCRQAFPRLFAAAFQTAEVAVRRGFALLRGAAVWRAFALRRGAAVWHAFALRRGASLIALALLFALPCAAQVRQYVIFEVSPEGASVYLDGQRLNGDRGFYYKLVDFGSHTYKVSAEGYSDETGVVLVQDFENKVLVNVRLVAAEYFGSLRVETVPAGAEIEIDGWYQGTTQPAGASAAVTGASSAVAGASSAVAGASSAVAGASSAVAGALSAVRLSVGEHRVRATLPQFAAVRDTTVSVVRDSTVTLQLCF